MYNENQKKAFIRQLNSNGITQTAENTFISIASYEKKMNKDICDISVREYPKILLGCESNIQRYSYYVDMLKVLLKYREYCAANGLIMPILFYESIDEKITYKQMLEEFKNIETTELYDPQSLYSFYSRILNINIESTPEDYYLGLLILYYYGLTNDDISNIRRGDIEQIQDTIKINLVNYQIELEGRCADHFIKLLKNTTCGTYYSERLKIYEMNREYLFARCSDKTEEERLKTVNNYTRYTTGKLKEQKNVPTISDIRHRGAIYRLCSDLIKRNTSKEVFFSLSNQRIYTNYYYYLHNIREVKEDTKVGTSRVKSIEVRYDLEKEWEYLENNIVRG